MKLVETGLILAVTIFIANCVTRTEAPATSVIESLRQQRDQIRSTNSAESMALSTTPDVGGLVGMAHSAILAGLGEPDLCWRPDHGECVATGEWVYIFYKLPSGERVDGPELHLIFDAGKHCQVAIWRMTR